MSSGPYRDAPPRAVAIGAAWKAPLCWAVGHDWKVLRQSIAANWVMAGLDEMAGIDADCKRCGKQHRDVVALARIFLERLTPPSDWGSLEPTARAYAETLQREAEVVYLCP